MKTYIATIVSAHNIGPAPSIRVRIADGRELDLRASTRAAIEAITLIGRRVRFQVQLSEATECLTEPLLVVGSEYGLRALSAGEVYDAVHDSNGRLMSCSVEPGNRI